MSQIQIKSQKLTVSDLQKQFKAQFGATLRVYKGKQFADKKEFVANLSGDKVALGTLVIKAGTTVDEFEKAFKERFGVTVQVATPDNSALSNNDHTLEQAGAVKPADPKFRVVATMKVADLKAQFKKMFGASLRVYKGIRFAADNLTVADVRVSDARGGSADIKGDMKVEDFEKFVLEHYGVKVQVAVADNSKLAKNDATLAEAAAAK